MRPLRGYVPNSPASRPWIGRLLLPGVIAAVLSAPSLGCGTPPATPDAPDKVRVVVLPFLAQMPLHIAAAEGFFEQQRLDVEFVRLDRFQDVMATLADGDVDAAAGMVTVNELNLIAEGARLRVVASLSTLDPQDCPFIAIVARRSLVDSGALNDPARIRGMRIDTDVVTPLGYYVDLHLRSFGLGLDDVDVVDVPPAAAVDQLSEGGLDATITAEPFLTLHARPGDTAVWSDVAELAPGNVHAAMMFGPALLDERPDVGRRFTLALLQAMRQYRQGKTARNLAIVQQASGLDPELLRAACWPRPIESGRVAVESLRDYQEWSLARGLVSGFLPEDRLVDHRFIDWANAQLER